ncbi:leucine-rich ppr motif-containing protein, mitochondrial [Plakobranchus ocellatus]|uniref:Leucine-rich ppr motif-containing protein, mitochondrial n=1 Tax=Plakobranchus ocellatus TaxID=259542 RepID=A0AAV3YNY7_9GAST|nr:leucine-rich ppr motif-containing protein, mitochondrial [Plakobranchus ocellatus]
MAAFIRCGAAVRSQIVASCNKGLICSAVFPQTLDLPVFSSTVPIRPMVTSVTEKEKLIDDVHRKIDYNQGISTQLFESLTASLESHGTLSEQDIGLLLHICSFGPFDSSSDKRLQFVEEAWNKLEKHGVSPSIKLFNIKLKAYCKNKKDFNALDELMKIKSMGLNPDKITYSLLIEGFCSQGDIDGANSVLEAMKTANLAINVALFNSFITGHLKAGSPEEAHKVLELIRSSGLNPNAQTFFKFAIFYAEEGDMDSVNKYINEAEEQGLPLDHSMLLDLHRTMITNGHSSAAAQLLKTISEKGIFSSMFMQKSCHLVAEGFVDAAVELYTMMPKVEEGKIVINSGNFLLRTMIVNGHTPQDVFNIADKIVEISPRSLAHRNALNFAYRAGKPDHAMELLQHMIAKNHVIKVPYIVPAICAFRIDKNVEGVYNATGLLLNLQGSGIRDDKLDQLVRCSYPALQHCGQSRENIVERFKDHKKLWNSIFFLDDLNTNGFDAALQKAEGKALDGMAFQWSDAPTSFVKHLPQDIDSCIEALHFIHEQDSVDQENFNYLTSRVVKYVMNQRNWPVLEKMLDNLLEKKMKKLCTGTGSYSGQRSRKGQFLSMEQLDEMSEEEVKKYQKKNPDRFLPRLVLLQKAMTADDLETMKQILRELQALGFNLTIVQTMKVITKLIQHNDVETAILYFEELKKLTGDSYRENIPLMIGEELIKQGNVEGTLQMIEVAKASKFPVVEPRSRSIKRNILASMLENAPTAEAATKVHSAMFESNPILADDDVMFIHGAYIKRISSTETDDELVNILLNMYQTHRTFPFHDFVLERLIKKEDVENLKKVMDLGNAAFGSNFFHHKLAFNFIRCGMLARGATVLKTPGFKLNERLINVNCQYLVKEKKIDVLEALVNVLKEMAVSQTSLLRHLVEGYVSVGNLKQASEAVQQFAMDYKQPPKSIVNFLIKAYSSSKDEVPEALNSILSIKSQSDQPESDSQPSDSDVTSAEDIEATGHADMLPKS